VQKIQTNRRRLLQKLHPWIEILHSKGTDEVLHEQVTDCQSDDRLTSR